MLRITVAETADQTAFECPLLFYWKKTHRADKNRKCIVDLNDVTFIGTKGERLLRTMSKQACNSSLAVSPSSICFKRGVNDEIVKEPNYANQTHGQPRHRESRDFLYRQYS